VSDRKASVIRSELPYAIVGTIIGVIAGGVLFSYTQTLERPNVSAAATIEPAPASGPLIHLDRR
jgi:cation transporter-like permease